MFWNRLLTKIKTVADPFDVLEETLDTLGAADRLYDLNFDEPKKESVDVSCFRMKLKMI